MSPTIIPGNFVIQSPAANDPLLDLNTQPSLDLQFATSKTLNDRVSGQNLITFSRSTTGTYVDSNGIIQTAAIDAPRFDHDPVTNASLGLLIEESRTNLVTNSTNPTWNVNAGGSGGTPTVTLVSDAAPDGSTNSAQRFQFDRGTENTANDYSLVSITTSAASALHSLSVWMRSNDSNTYTLIFYDSSGGKGEEIIVTPSWKRYVLDASTSYKNSNPQSATSASLIFGLRNDPTSINFFTGNTNSQTADILAWGPQIEAGAFPTSYIPTSGSALPRAADVASITGSNFSRWYNQSEGTVYIDFDKATTERQQPFALGDGAQTNRMSAYYINTDAVTYMSSPAGGFDQSVYTAPSPLLSSKYTIRYSSGNTRPVVNGNLGIVITEPNLPTNTTLYLGRREQGDTTYMLSGHISRLTYYPYRLPDATLQEITS